MRALAVLVALASVARAQPSPSPSPAAPSPPSSAAAAPPPPTDDEGTPKLSLPTEADRIAWTRPGFRLGLAFAYGDMVGLRGAPSGRLLGPIVRAGLRLDAEWSIVASFQYALASKSHGLSGLRFAGTIDPTWHVTPSLSLAVGLGFGGIVEGRSTGRVDMTPDPHTPDTSVTLSSASPPLPSCSGVGAAGLVRAEWQYVLGPRSELAVALEGLGQYTECVQRTGALEPDTARPIERRQYWPHAGAQLSVGITWR